MLFSESLFARLSVSLSLCVPLLSLSWISCAGSSVLGQLFWVTCPGSHVLGHMSWMTCAGPAVLGHLSWVTYPESLVLVHLSWVICPALPVLCYLALIPYPESLHRDVFSPSIQRVQLSGHNALSSLVRGTIWRSCVLHGARGYMASSDARGCTVQVVTLHLVLHVVARCKESHHVKFFMWLPCVVTRAWLHGAWSICLST